MEQAGTLQPVWRVPVKQETSDTPTDTRQRDSVKTHLGATGCRRPPEAGTEARNGLCPGAIGGSAALPASWSGTSGLQH